MIEKICIILLANIAFFSKTLCYKYVSDDIPSSQRKENHPRWKYWLLVLEGHLKSTPQIDHAITSALHALVCAFTYTAFRPIEISAFGTDNISFWAALLFSFTPINNQGSVWISGRGYVLSALGMTMAMTFAGVGPLLLLLATYSNAGFLAPVCLIGSEHAWLLWFMPLIWGFHFFRFKRNVIQKMETEMFDEDKKFTPKKIILGIKTFSFYFIHSVIPIKNTFYHSYLQGLAGTGKARGYSINDRFFWLGLVIVGSIIYYWTHVPWNIASFGLLWWCVCLAPFCNVMRMQQEIAERYAYLPSVGLMVALSYFIQGHPAIFVAIMCIYTTKLWFWMDAYVDDYFLAEASCVHSPDSWFAWHVRAMKRWDTQSYQEAVILWTMARLISPLEFKINFNIATALHLSGHKKEAEQFLKIAADNIPKGQEAQANGLVQEWKNGRMAVLL